jgi:hypothetical protein
MGIPILISNPDSEVKPAKDKMEEDWKVEEGGGGFVFVEINKRNKRA